MTTVLSILHYPWRGADHLKLSAYFLNLIGLLLERCGQRLNLPFLQSNPCRLLFSRSLQLLHDLTLFEHLFYRERMARRGGAELAIRIYHNRVAVD